MGAVLLAESDVIVGRVALRVLERAGHDVVLVTSLYQARRAVTHQAWDLLVLDLSLHDGSGFELLTHLRLDLGSALPVVVLSGLRQDLVRERSLRLGADDFVTRPFNPAHLAAAAGRLVPLRTHHADVA